MTTYLAISGQPLGVPYYRDASDTSSASYIDLKREPHRVDEIPEAREWDSLRRLLNRLNAPQSQLMSLGCGVFIYPPDPPTAAWNAYAYVGYCFADLARNEDAATFFPQFFHFSQHHRRHQEPTTDLFFELRPTGFYEQNAHGFSVDFIVKAFGNSESELRLFITRHLDALYEFLPLTGLVGTE